MTINPQKLYIKNGNDEFVCIGVRNEVSQLPIGSYAIHVTAGGFTSLKCDVPEHALMMGALMGDCHGAMQAICNAQTPVQHNLVSDEAKAAWDAFLLANAGCSTISLGSAYDVYKTLVANVAKQVTEKLDNNESLRLLHEQFVMLYNLTDGNTNDHSCS